MKQTADIVIVGAGIVGSSAAYFLSQKGWKNIVVLDQGPLFNTGGSSSHAPGLVFALNSSKTMCKLAQWSIEAYQSLKFEGEPCFYPVGSIEVAQTPERWEDLKTKWGRALSWGLKGQLISPEEVQIRFPLVDKSQILGGLYIPTDGIAKAIRAASAFAHEAQKQACEFYGNTVVHKFIVKDHKIQGVETDHGVIHCGKVLLCGGIWGPQLGKKLGITIPLVPVQHQYINTTSIKELEGETRECVMPILRHQDRSLYFRQQGDHLGIGSYSHEPLLVDAGTLGVPDKSNPQPAMLPFTDSHFQKAYANACELIPSLGRTDLGHRFNGMFSFTPDGNPLMGETLKIKDLWLAEAVWVTHAAGVAKAVSTLMSNETVPLDLHELDCNRFWDHSYSPEYIRERGAQQYREVYDIIHPLQQIEHPRPLRTSPFYPRQKELGAVFFESAAWERPQWYTTNAQKPRDPSWPERKGWTARYWSPVIGQEHKATRESVALFDLSPFTKLEVKGRGALEFLQGLSANQIDQAPGKIVYTTMLNVDGGIMCDLTITRWEQDRFWVITGGAIGRHDKAWMTQHLPENANLSVQDITSNYCCLGVWGPAARKLIEELSECDLSNEGFPFYTAKEIYIGSIPCFALRISYVGELGWEIYTSTEYGLSLWDKLWASGQKHGIIAAGGGAFDSLRLEKGYRLWGADIHSEYNPFEAGLAFAVRLAKPDFIGKAALEHIKAECNNDKRKLCCLVLDSSDIVLMGKEPILYNNQVLAYVTSANYGYTVNKSIAYAYLPLEFSEPSTKLEVQFFGKRYGLQVAREPLFDSSQSRLKS